MSESDRSPDSGGGLTSGWPVGRGADGGIDRIPLPITSGQLWLCGKHAIGPDPEACLARVSATTVVCLTERHELNDRFPTYVEWLGSIGPARALWFPIHDLGAPSLHTAVPVLDDIAARLGDDERIVMHCAAGIGRAGTMAVATLMRLGVQRVDAMSIVAAHRPMAGPEAGAQMQFLVAYEVHLAEVAQRSGALD